jgi:hypothetical protein
MEHRRLEVELAAHRLKTQGLEAAIMPFVSAAGSGSFASAC